MNVAWIKKTYYQKLPGNPIRPPRQRFTQYYADLCVENQQAPMHAESFTQGTQYTYVELFDSLLPSIQAAGDLDDLQLIVISFWSPEFDPDYACGAYLCHRYQFAGKIFDISDCGFLAPFIALAAIQVYMRQENITRALFLGADQTTVPYFESIKTQSFPQCASVGALLFAQDALLQSGLRFITAACVADQQLIDFLLHTLEQEQIKLENVLLTCQQDSFDKNFFITPLPFKNIVYTTHAGNSIEKLFSLAILQHKNYGRYYRCHILLVHDPRDNQWGVLIVEVIL